MKIDHRIYKSRLSALLAAKRCACDGLDMLSISCLSAPEMIDEMWALFGDGRSIIDSDMRVIIVSSLLSDFGFNRSFGSAQMVSRFIEKVSGVLRSTEAEGNEEIFDNADLNESERRMVELARCYRSAIFSLGYIEQGEAVYHLKNHKDLFDFEIAEPLFLDEPLSSFFGDDCDLFSKQRFCLEDIEIKFLLAAGPSVLDCMAIDDLQHDMDSGRFSNVALICSNPLTKLHSLHKSEVLQDCMRVNLVGSVRFCDTVLGRFLRAIQGMRDAKDRERFVACASDVTTSVLSGISRFTYTDLYGCAADNIEGESVSLGGDDGFERTLKPQDLNTIWRQDRTLDEASIIEQMKRLSKTFSFIFQSLVEGDVCECNLGDLKHKIPAQFSGVNLEIELKALSRLVKLDEQAREVGVNPSVLLDMILDSSLKISAENNDYSGTGSITVIDPATASNIDPKTFDAIYLLDISDEAFGIKDRDCAVDRSLSKLGIVGKDNRVEMVRWLFCSLLKTTKDKIAIGFSQRDSKGEERFAPFIFDELASEILGQGKSARDLIEICKSNLKAGVECVTMPNGVSVSAATLSEEALSQGVARCVVTPTKLDAVLSHERGKLTDEMSGYVLNYIESDSVSYPILSASSIETYMCCPYKWFIERKLRLTEIQDCLGALERGTFLHRVLELFYEIVMDSFDGKLVDMSDDQIDDTIDSVYDKALEEQKGLGFDSLRYIPLTEAEIYQDRSQRRNLKKSVKLLKRLPSNYFCSAVEQVIDARQCVDEKAFYGGAVLNGKIDRVDVSDDGQSFYIIDYKGSIENASAGQGEFGFIRNDEGRWVIEDEDKYPDHIQTLIYASLVEKLDRLKHNNAKCTAAFYASYKSKGDACVVAGSYPVSSATFAEISDKKSSVEMEFCEFLDLVEQLVSVKVDSLRHASISLNPHNDAACNFCNYTDCEARR